VKFIESKYFGELDHSKLDFEYGNVYLFDNFVIAEIYEGIHLDWDKTKVFAEKLIEYYGSGIKLGYISNRVNSYSVDPQSWKRTEKTYNLVLAASIVSYNVFSSLNAKIENHFATNKIQNYASLDEAISWIKSI